MKTSRHRDGLIAAVLAAFCGAMTFLLIRSEYYPESSPLHRIPPRYVAERFLRYESSSSLKMIWKDEDIGSVMIRVTPGERPLLNGSAQLTFPVLGQRPKIRLDVDCLLKSNRDIERFRMHGKLQDVGFKVSADASSDRVEIEAKGAGLEEKRTFRWSEWKTTGGRNLLREIPGLPPNTALPSEENVTALSQKARWIASMSRIHRLGDWMDAYLLEARIDANAWLKLWMSPTGELLKLESSFGLRALNEDFFRGIPST